MNYQKIPTPTALFTEIDRQRFELFKKFEESQAAQAELEAPAPKASLAPPTDRTLRMLRLLDQVHWDQSDLKLDALRAWREIRDKELWRDTFPSFDAFCAGHGLNPRWVADWFLDLEVYESLPQRSQLIINNLRDIDQLREFPKSERVAILDHVEARGNRLMFSVRVREAAALLGLQPEGAK